MTDAQIFKMLLDGDSTCFPAAIVPAEWKPKSEGDCFRKPEPKPPKPR